MAFFAAGVWKGAQYVKREVKKSNQRNALIVADDTVPRDKRTLSVQRDFWDDATAAPPAPAGDGLVPLGDSQRSASTSLEDEEAEVEVPLPRPPSPPPPDEATTVAVQEPPANADVQEPPASAAVQEPPSNVAVRKHPASGVVRGSYVEQLQARGALPDAPARAEASAPVKIGVSYAAHLQAQSDAAPAAAAAAAPTRPVKTALKKTATRPRAVPGSFSAALESGELQLPPPTGCRRQPRKDTQPADAPLPTNAPKRPAVPSGSFAEAQQRERKATASPASGAAVRKGSFREATRRRQGDGASWNDFIDKTAAQGGQ